MNIKQRIEQNLKAALLSGDKDLVTVLRGLKSAILYEEVALGKRETGLNEEETQVLLKKEAKKRRESAELYVQGNAQERADKELQEKAIIDEYLPEELSDEALLQVVEQAITEVGDTSPQAMGKVIGLVKQKVGTTADGGRIAKLVKEKLGTL